MKPRPATWGLTVGCLALMIGASAGAATLPNLLWIVAEDINPHLGCYGDTNAVTPNLDRFAASALRYATCWSVAPVCAPARTALITGVYPTTTGAEHMRSMVGMPPFMRMYPQFLRERGYYCANNNKEDYNLAKNGKVWDESSGKAHYRNRQPGQPFFAAFNLGATHEGQIRRRPHTLMHDPAGVRVPAYHPDTPEVRHDWAQYYDNLTEMDELFGSRLKELEDAGLAEKTIVFFYGDNGSGMPRSKRWPYNSGLHVPLIVRVPESLRDLAPEDYVPGGVSQRLVSFVDFAPTLLSLAGIKPPQWMQGQAFMGSHPASAPAHIFGLRGRMDERYDLVRSVRNQRFIYIRNYLPHLVYGQYLQYMFQTPTTRIWKQLYDEGRLRPPQTFFWQAKPAEELYDLRADPEEIRNLAGSGEHTKVLEELRRVLREHLLANRDLGFLTEAEIQRRTSGRAPYDLGQNRTAYPLERILEMAEAASQPSTSPSRLKGGLRDNDPAVRYWAAMGCMIHGQAATRAAEKELKRALADAFPSVRVAAAMALGKSETPDLRAKSLETLKQLASPVENGVYVSLLALNAIDYLGAQTALRTDFLKGLPREDPSAIERVRGYTARLLERSP